MSAMPTLLEKLFTILNAYCAATSVQPGTVANRVFLDGKRFDALAAGADLKTRSYEKAMLWFSANWPEAAAWPEGIERPEIVDGDAIDPEPNAARRGNSVQDDAA